MAEKKEKKKGPFIHGFTEREIDSVLLKVLKPTLKNPAYENLGAKDRFLIKLALKKSGKLQKKREEKAAKVKK